MRRELEVSGDKTPYILSQWQIFYFSPGTSWLSRAMALRNVQGTGESILFYKNSHNCRRYASSFGDCSEKCGPGKMSRRVFCIKVLLQLQLIPNKWAKEILCDASRTGARFPQRNVLRTWSRWRRTTATTIVPSLQMEVATMQQRYWETRGIIKCQKNWCTIYI